MSTYATLSLYALNNKTKYNIDDVVKNYNVGDIIYYSGKCHNFSQFYAKIDNITPTSMGITVLELEYEDDKINFYETDSSISGLTGRPFYLVDAKS